MLNTTATDLNSKIEDLVATLRGLSLQEQHLEKLRRLASDIFTHLCIARKSMTSAKKQCTSKL